MKWLKNYKLFKESKEINISYKNLVVEVCTAMELLNNEFLSNLLDRGLKARYSENSDIFITDLKNLLLAKNRLHLGKFNGDTCESDIDLGKINSIFENTHFDIEKDWNKLMSARNNARSIIDKILPDNKLNSEKIDKIYWIGPNKNKEHQEDLVLEMEDGSQYSFYIEKSLTTQKSASFNKFGDEFIGDDIDRLYSEDYSSRWNKLTQEWIKLMYENSNKNIQKHIEKFIDPKRIDTIDYFDYFNIRHRDPKFKHLGEHIEEFDKNILKFQDLLDEVWKNRNNCFMDPERVTKEWMETKVVILNSKILENLLTTSLKLNHDEDIQNGSDDGWKLSTGTVKMKLFKILVEKLGCLERPVYYVGKNGNTFDLVPERDFFRKYYDDLDIKFDYHVRFVVNENEEENDFKIKIKVELDSDMLMEMIIIVKPTKGELDSKLSAKYKFEIPENFNYIIQKKKLDITEEE
jgi:hypothetical protein